MVEATLFISAAIIGITEFIKTLSPKVSGALTIVVAVVVGLVVALSDAQIGVQGISIAQGIMTALGSVGVVTVANKI